MKPVPYVGIVGFRDFEMVMKLLKVFKMYWIELPKHVLHIGTMMSYKTLYGLPSRNTNVFPKNEEHELIFGSDDEDIYNCLHYADFGRENYGELWKDLARAIAFGGIGINSLQLDMCWPEPVQIANAVHASRKQIDVILQIGRSAFEEIGENPQKLVERLAEYDGVVQRVLLDRSMGEGIPIDAGFLLPFIRAIRKIFPEMGIGVAGGLGPVGMHRLEPIADEFCISFDAQSGLTQKRDRFSPLSFYRSVEYLYNASRLFYS